MCDHTGWMSCDQYYIKTTVTYHFDVTIDTNHY